jgi:hypothetical protein
MKRVIALAIALACAACGGGDTTPPDAPIDPGSARGPASKVSQSDNEAPEIESVELTPNPATAAEAITLAVKVHDPERDRVSTRVEWYKNGELITDAHGVVLDAGTFSRGDRVYAIVYAEDAAHEVTAQTQAITIANAAPRVRSVFVSPSKPTAADILQADVNAQDADGDSLEFTYRWYKNGQEIPAATTSRLSPGTVHRGDKVTVEARAADGSDTGEWTQSPIALISNAAPVITSQPSYEMTPTGSYTYTVAAKDADDDTPLRYELVEGPKGMVIDESSGTVSWAVPEDAHGNSRVEVAVSDSLGGRVTQSWVLAVDWNAPPANAEETPKQKPAKTAKAKSHSDGESGANADEESAGDETVKKPAAKTAVRKNTPAKAEAGDDEEAEPDQGEEPEE